MPRYLYVKATADSVKPLRVSVRKGRSPGPGRRKGKAPSILVKCGCCAEDVEIFFEKSMGDPDADTLEINGVQGTLTQWRRILAPLLASEKLGEELGSFEFAKEK